MNPAASGEQTRRPSFVTKTIVVLAGPIVWAAHLLVIYGAHAIICSQRASTAGVRATVGIATLVALAALTGIVVRGFQGLRLHRMSQTGRFLGVTMILLIVLSAAAIAWAGSAALFLPACLVLR
jgi:hypothetical protein